MATKACGTITISKESVIIKQRQAKMEKGYKNLSSVK